jgi:hypothetical protein
LPGDRGIYINSNRFENYMIQNNEISNVTDAISMVCAPRPFVGGIGWFEPVTYSTTTYYWNIVYARDASIVSNTISSQLNTSFSGSSNNYLRNAITLACPLNIWSTWATAGIKTENNKIYRAHNGISITGLNSIGIGNHVDGPPKMIATNTITLEEDNIWTATQNGIEFANSIPAPYGYPTYTSQALQSIESNVADVLNAPLTNTHIAMVRCFGNGGVSPTGSVMPAPHIICNDVSNANKGFLFEGPNQLTYWRGNSMTNLSMGMALTNSAVIGPQGTTVSSSDNLWLGSWTSYSNTYTDAFSDAAASRLFVQNTSTTYPSNNPGFFSQQAYSYSTNITIVTGGASTYVCGGGYGQLIAPLPPSGDPSTDARLYIAMMQAYRQLYYAPALRADEDDESFIFYSDLAGSSFDIFTQIEDTLSRGNIVVAQDLLGSLDQSDFNVVETNYYSFYDLYLKYVDPADPEFTSEDLETLTALASLCPGTNGIPAYQARALYLMITGRVFNAPGECDERTGARPAIQTQSNNVINTSKIWHVDLFPNPASDQLFIASSTENEMLEVTIRDITGRMVLHEIIKSKSYISKLNLNLINGAYILTISNLHDECVVKKLLIAK